MTNNEKLQLLRIKPNEPCCLADYYYGILEQMDAIKYNYCEYMTTEPICCNIELERINEADFELCAALFTMLLREDHFAQYGCFEERCEKGDVQKIIDRMIYLVETEES